jgi:hypothetical protein
MVQKEKKPDACSGNTEQSDFSLVKCLKLNRLIFGGELVNSP